MLDIKYVKENLEEVKKALAKKHTQFDLDGLIKLYDEKHDLQTRVEELRTKRNQLSRDVKNIEEAKKIKEMLSDLEPNLQASLEAYLEEAAKIHNIPDKSVPSFEEGSKIEKKWGDPPKFDFKPKDHLTLGENLDIVDVERAVKVSGARFGYFKGAAVQLQFALINWVLEKLIKEKFTPLIPPVLVKETAMFGTGFFPSEKVDFYKTEKDDLYLVGTAEVPLASYHAKEVLDGDKLPLKYCAYSSCFRREAGTYGKDTRGVLRVHQFDKIEMFKFCKPEESWEDYGELLRIAEEILEELRIPYQRVNMSGGDIGAPNAKKYDIEGWFPSQKKYRELQSCSHDTDFQARRLNIKYRTKDGKKDYVHTTNSTAIALGRTMICLMENNQSFDKASNKLSIKIPEVLHRFLPFREIK